MSQLRSDDRVCEMLFHEDFVVALYWKHVGFYGEVILMG